MWAEEGLCYFRSVCETGDRVVLESAMRKPPRRKKLSQERKAEIALLERLLAELRA